jgi:ribose transport system permease protein
VAFAEGYALVGLLLALAAFFSVLPSTSDTFSTAANLRVLLSDQSILLIISLAVMYPIITGVWDFTPGANAGMAAIFAASVGASSGSVILAIAAALAVGLCVGVVNGLLVTVGKINSVIATFGMTIIIAGVVQLKTGGNSIVSGIPSGFASFGSSSVLGIPKLFWVAIIVSLVAYYTLRRTPYGRYLYAIGSRRSAATLVGIRTESLTFSTFVISGLIAGIAGVLILCRSGTGNPQVGGDFIIPAYAAVFLGATSITPGRWNVWGLVIAILFLGTLNSGLTLMGAQPYVNDFANGAALLVGVGFANLLARQRGRDLTTA